MKTKKLTIFLAVLTCSTMLCGVPAFAEEAAVTTDPAGNEITLPESVDKIISMSPSSTQFLIDLGLADKIIACDTYSAADYAEDLAADIPAFDMMTPDNEQLVALMPDLIITTGMSSSGGEDVFAAVKEAGICVADIPSGSSLQDVEDSLLFIGEAVGAEELSAEIVAQMNTSIEEIGAIGASISEEEQKSVLYEISTPTADYPTIYTAGGPTYINEMIELIGAVNVAADQDTAWPALTEEDAIAMDPDVILTTDVYTENVIDTLLALSGWENVSAIANEEVYLLDANEINRPNQHLISALVEMGKVVYPDAFAEIEDPFAAE